MSFASRQPAVGAASFGVGVSAGVISGASFIHKFGFNPDIATAEETVWDGANLYATPNDAGEEVFFSSSDNGDVSEITVEGLDENFNLQTVTKALAGQTKTTLGASLLWSRVFRAYNSKGAALAGDVYVYGDVAAPGGVPGSDIYIKIVQGEEQTLMAVYTVPRGKTGYLYRVYFTPDAIQIATFKLVTKEFGRTYRTRDLVVIGGGTTTWQYGYPFPTRLEQRTDIEVRSTLSAGAGSVAAGFDILLIDNS